VDRLGLEAGRLGHTFRSAAGWSAQQKGGALRHEDAQNGAARRRALSALAMARNRSVTGTTFLAVLSRSRGSLQRCASRRVEFSGANGLAWPGLLQRRGYEQKIKIFLDPDAQQHILGHASITNTVRYTVMSPEPFKDIWRGKR